MIHKIGTHAELQLAYDVAEPHLKPILEAVRDFRCGMFFVEQCDEPFRLPNDPGHPAISVIGDDMERALGPKGFHMPSVRRLIRASEAFAIVSCAPLQAVYAALATQAAMFRFNVLLIETRPEQEIAWMALIQKLQPKRFIYLATVEGGHA